MPQIVLQVPPEVLRLLGAIRSSLQRIEQEVRDCKLRLGWPAVHAQPPAPAIDRNAASSESGKIKELPKLAIAQPAAPPAGSRGYPRGLAARHAPPGRAAANRMKDLQVRLGISRTELARRLGMNGSGVSNIAAGKRGISHRIHEAMVKLEAAAR
jgi:hypothetical protein